MHGACFKNHGETQAKINGGTEGEDLEMEGGIWEQGPEGKPRKDKIGSEWG